MDVIVPFSGNSMAFNDQTIIILTCTDNVCAII